MKYFVLSLSFMCILVGATHAQDKRAQLTPFLSRGYASVSIGYINYPYTNADLNQGFTAHEIKIPHLGMRAMIGSQINKYLSINYSVMRGALWPTYSFYNSDGELKPYNVWVNEWGFTLKGHFPINEKSSFFIEGGLGLFARNGFRAHNYAEIPNANYATLLCGAGFQHAFSKKFDWVISTSYSPQNKAEKQPYTILFSAGAVFHMRPLPDSVVAENSKSSHLFPKQFIQIGGASNIAGYHANNAVSISPHFIGIPIFWRGAVQTVGGAAINYQRNVFHTKKSFSIDWGTSISFYETEKMHDQFYTISIFPVLRLWYLRTKAADFYWVYAIVGPSYISKVKLDDKMMGKNLTYQDFMGTGAFFGKTRKLNAELKIQHYSNGNNFAVNPGVDIPLMLNVGYAF